MVSWDLQLHRKVDAQAKHKLHTAPMFIVYHLVTIWSPIP